MLHKLTGGDGLKLVIYLSFKKLNLFESLNINQKNFVKFLFALQDNYNNALYHNKIHASDMT